MLPGEIGISTVRLGRFMAQCTQAARCIPARFVFDGLISVADTVLTPLAYVCTSVALSHAHNACTESDVLPCSWHVLLTLTCVGKNLVVELAGQVAKCGSTHNVRQSHGHTE